MIKRLLFRWRGKLTFKVITGDRYISSKRLMFFLEVINLSYISVDILPDYVKKVTIYKDPIRAKEVKILYRAMDGFYSPKPQSPIRYGEVGFCAKRLIEIYGYIPSQIYYSFN